MRKLQIIFVYLILCLFSVLAIRCWYQFFTEFLSEESIANGIIAMLFTAISIAGWVLRKEIIKGVIK